MLDRLQKIATAIVPHTLLFSVLIVAFLVLGVFGLATNYSASEALMQTGIIGTLWAGLLFAFAHLFQRVPPAPADNERFFRKWKVKIQRALYTLLATVVLVATGAVLSMSARLAML